MEIHVDFSKENGVLHANITSDGGLKVTVETPMNDETDDHQTGELALRIIFRILSETSGRDEALRIMQSFQKHVESENQN